MKNSNSQMRIKDANGVNRVIHSDGTILASDNRAENLKQVRQITFGNQEPVETLLPAGMELEDEPAKSVQANSDENLMLPTGFQLNTDGSISTPSDRMKKVEPTEQKAETQANSDSELMLPAGIELES